MNIDEIKKLIVEIEKGLKNSPIVYTGYLTTSGKVFENDYRVLLEFTNFSNIIFGLSNLFQPFSEFANKVSEDIMKEFVVNMRVPESFTDEDTSKARRILGNNFELFLDQIEKESKLKEKIIGYLEHQNSCFFLSLYSYMDNYLNTISELIKPHLDEDNLQKLESVFETNKGLNEKISTIKNVLPLCSDSDFGSLLKGRAWEITFCNFIKRRHDMAHKDPKVKLLILEKYFKKQTDNARSNMQKISKGLSTEPGSINLDILRQYLERFISIFKINIMTLFTLIEIGKECFGYFAIIDILIFSKIE